MIFKKKPKQFFAFSNPYFEFILIDKEEIIQRCASTQKGKRSFPILPTQYAILTGITKHRTVTSAKIEMEGNISTFVLISNKVTNLEMIIKGG